MLLEKENNQYTLRRASNSHRKQRPTVLAQHGEGNPEKLHMVLMTDITWKRYSRAIEPYHGDHHNIVIGLKLFKYRPSRVETHQQTHKSECLDGNETNQQICSISRFNAASIALHLLKLWIRGRSGQVLVLVQEDEAVLQDRLLRASGTEQLERTHALTTSRSEELVHIHVSLLTERHSD